MNALHQDHQWLKFQSLTNTPSFLPDATSHCPAPLYMCNVPQAAAMSSVFGTMQADRGARVVQFSLRLDF